MPCPHHRKDIGNAKAAEAEPSLGLISPKPLIHLVHDKLIKSSHFKLHRDIIKIPYFFLIQVPYYQNSILNIIYVDNIIKYYPGIIFLLTIDFTPFLGGKWKGLHVGEVKIWEILLTYPRCLLKISLQNYMGELPLVAKILD